jgi:hypothetical protein
MNERIRELAEQCGFRSNPDIYDRNQSFDIPKFAELIVRECADIATMNQYQHFATGTYVLKHFGVEE